jgi:hypothetical protein
MIALRIRQRLNQHRRQRTLTGRPATNRRRPTSQLPPCRALQARPSNQVRGSEISLDTCTVGLHEQVETATKYSQVAVETPSTVRAQLAISTSTNNATFELLDHNTRDGVSKCRRRRNGRRGRSLDGSGKRCIADRRQSVDCQRQTCLTLSSADRQFVSFDVKPAIVYDRN